MHAPVLQTVQHAQGASAPLRDGDQKADIAIVFVSGAHAALDKAGRISARIRDHLPSLQCIFGASVRFANL